MCRTFRGGFSGCGLSMAGLKEACLKAVVAESTLFKLRLVPQAMLDIFLVHLMTRFENVASFGTGASERLRLPLRVRESLPLVAL